MLLSLIKTFYAYTCVIENEYRNIIVWFFFLETAYISDFVDRVEFVEDNGGSSGCGCKTYCEPSVKLMELCLMAELKEQEEHFHCNCLQMFLPPNKHVGLVNTMHVHIKLVNY